MVGAIGRVLIIVRLVLYIGIFVKKGSFHHLRLLGKTRNFQNIHPVVVVFGN